MTKIQWFPEGFSEVYVFVLSVVFQSYLGALFEWAPNECQQKANSIHFCICQINLLF